ncbi:hypothetical protein Nepgr_001862 [Nepenthes gracilis]|uniref:Uncharacterized protein n=1 Tax=Nepenthes gracilis TaxID=150966 RepID=A0AAD3P7Y3_NEPGR|nr:hypothetical protein Nepgr_001862 [Nepenthes gracilis]
MDLKNHQQQQHLYNMSVGSSIPSPNHKIPHSSNGLCQDQSEEHKDSPTEAADGQLLEQLSTAAVDSNGNVNCGSREDNSSPEEFDLPESLEHILPDNLFYSPTKSAGEPLSIFSPIPSELDGGNISASSNSNNDPLMPPASALTMAPLKSCFLEMPRFSSGHGAIRM